MLWGVKNCSYLINTPPPTVRACAPFSNGGWHELTIPVNLSDMADVR